jgi:hypothetical protein
MPTELPIGYVVTRFTGSAVAGAAHRDRRDRRGHHDPHGHPGHQDPSLGPKDRAIPGHLVRPGPGSRDLARGVDRRGHLDRPG